MRGKSVVAIALCACGLAACLMVAGCGSTGSGQSTGPLKDGSYTGRSSVLDANVDGDGYVIVSLKVENGVVSDASFEAFEPDGTIKDKNYGKDGAYYAVAQKALSAGDEYLEQFKQTGDPNAIDTISGATYLHDLFVEAANNALDQAAE